jgi:protein TonB
MQTESTLEFVSQYRNTEPRTNTRFLIWASLALHAMVVTLVVVTPLLEVTDVPDVESVATFMVSAAPPPPPPPAAPPSPARNTRSETPRRVVRDTDLISPIAIPDEIPNEDFGAGALGEPFGVAGGIPGGVAGGIVGGLPEAPAPPRAREPIRLDHRAAEARIAVRAEPVYPELAVQARVQGVVILEVLVGEEGTPRQIKVLRSVPMLEQAAKDAVEQWRWEPYNVAGTAVPFLVTVTVSFRLAS